MQHRRIAAPIEEDEALLTARDALLQRGDQRWRQRRVRAARLRLLVHVDKPHLRQHAAADTQRQREPRIAAFVGALPTLERRRRRPEDDAHRFALAAVNREVTRRVARAFLLLVRRVVLFVDDDEPEPRHRREHREPRAEHHVGEAEVRREPAGEALGRRQCTVQRDDVATGESLCEASFELRREVDLGHQHQRLPARIQTALGRAQIDLGLAAAGHAVQQDGRCAQRIELRRRDRPGRNGEALAQLRDAVGDLRVVELAKFGRQHRERDFTDAALVVAGTEFDELAPSSRQRRQRRKRLADGTQFADDTIVGAVIPDDAGHFALAKRRSHQCSRQQRALTGVGQRRAQSAVMRRLDSDANALQLSHQHGPMSYASNFELPSKKPSKPLIWLIFWFLSTILVDNFVGNLLKGALNA